MATLFGYDEIFLQHRTGNHPERPARLTSILEELNRHNLLEQFLQVENTPEPDEWIKKVHNSEYIERLAEACDKELPFIDTPDSAICADSCRVARRAVAITLGACDMIMAGEADNGFCALRPPGHHAEHDRSMGFCLFNNVAIAAKYLQLHHGLKRILILDWDVHHGNGTQHTFERDATVFYGSLHQHPATLYPGTGWPNEFGEGPGRGFTLNMPLAPGDGDKECLELFRENFLSVAREFRPQFILVSAGFDGHRKDPLAELQMTEDGFNELTRQTKALAQECCGGRLLSVLEGGYHLAALSACVLGHIRLLAGYYPD